MIKNMLHGLCVVLTVCCAYAAAGLADQVRSERLTFVLVCDIYKMQPRGDGRGGMAKIAAVIAAERAAGPNVLVAHAGDTISPSLMSGIDQGAHMIDLLNMIEPDIFVPGNHEYDFGPQVFVKRMAEAAFPVYAANLAGADGKPIAGIGAGKLIEMGGVKVGVVGLTAEDSVKRSSPGDLVFSSSVETGRKLARALRKQGADLIVAVVHASRKMDRKLVKAAFADIILSGDDHDLVLEYDGDTVLAEAMQDGLYIIAVDVEVRTKDDGKRRKVSWWPNFRLIDTANVEPDAAVAERIAHYQGLLDAEFDVAVGKTATELDSRNAAVRGGEAAIGNLIADAVRAQTGADVAVLNGGGIRGNKVYAAGSEITRRDVLSELPFGNKTYVLEMTGKALTAVLEQGLARAHKRTTGAFPQVSGMTVKADTSRKKGERIVSLMIDGVPVDPGKVYKVATNDFLAGGGNGYKGFAGMRQLVGDADGKLVANHVMAYIKAAGTVAPKIEGRTVIARE